MPPVNTIGRGGGQIYKGLSPFLDLTSQGYQQGSLEDLCHSLGSECTSLVLVQKSPRKRHTGKRNVRSEPEKLVMRKV